MGGRSAPSLECFANGKESRNCTTSRRNRHFRQKTQKTVFSLSCSAPLWCLKRLPIRKKKKRCNDTPLAPQWQPCPLRPSHIGSRLAAPHPPRYTSVSKLGVQTIRLEPSEEGWTIGPCSKIASKSPGFRGTQIFTPTSDIDQKDLNVQLQLLTGSGLLPPLLADATRSCRKGQHQLQGLQGNMVLGVKGPMAEGRSMPKPYLWSSAVCCVSATSKSREVMMSNFNLFQPTTARQQASRLSE